ncbi:E3 ubiquitin-protein ligase RNF6 isoform X1 [Scyliorhinus canicula]|uniref:E3 ubiquitin-protein ligase RNF6 isoform X1 n=3 Tax=Scyliorhinus canicula TaxID=7830 RepID=UPI0018F46A85|nr:E3 ubiquitin-protein ligase RNF6 isoform X1 [Scyliorhinus canicula]XP_038675069.1 E3 ubiquitin-protein ligase RNF6 isoform X1 [Scyliorhinus canicula]
MSFAGSDQLHPLSERQILVSTVDNFQIHLGPSKSNNLSQSMEDTSNTDVEVSLQVIIYNIKGSNRQSACLLVGIPSTMDPPNPANHRGNQQSPTQNMNRSEDERNRQLERLSREEAYYQFINDLSEEDYRLMRDSNLLGTPGEITAEELQQRLDGAKEQLTTQNGLGNNERERIRTQGSETPGESSNSDSLLEWLNTFRRTGNATRSGQSGNQTWRAVSRTNPNSGEFRFSLEININHEHESGIGQPLDTSALENNRNQNTENAQSQSLLNPIASRTRSRTRAQLQLANEQTNSESNFGGTLRIEEVETVEVTPPLARRNIRSETIGRTTDRQRPRRQGVNRQAGLSVAIERQIGRRRARQHSVRTIPEDWSEPVELQRDNIQTGERNRNVHRQMEQRRSSRNFHNQRSRSPLRRESVTVNSLDRPLSHQEDNLHPRQSTRRQRTMDQSTMTTEELQTVSSNPSAQSTTGGMHRQEALDEGDLNNSSGSSAAVRRHPTIMLDLQVRRIRPGENRDRDSIANRTRSRVRMAENTVTFESDSGGFRRTISRSELAGIRTYVSTIRIPLRRISETGLGEPSSIALRSILRQIMTGFGELSSLMENDSDSELNQRVQQNPSDNADSISSQINPNSNFLNPNNESTGAFTGDRSGMNESTQNESFDNAAESRETRQIRDTNSLVENGTLPILRLAHFFLLNDDDEEERQRGLTKEQIDNLLTRNYGNISAENEVSKTCSVCINEYAIGNKLRRLPCAHEFHIHCIDRWLSENSTCPICRQPILGSSN